MAENTIIIEFIPCEPAPANGYLVKYRPLGSLGEYRVVSPNQTESPIVIVDENDPPGTSYEGTIQGDCGGGIFGPPSPWEFGNDQSQSGSGSISFGPVVCPYHIVVMTENLGFNDTSCENIKYWVKLVDDNGDPVMNPLGVNIKVNATASYIVGDCATPSSSFTVTGDLEIAPGQSESYNFFAATAPNNIVANLTLNSVDPAVLNDCDILLPASEPFDYYLADEYDCGDCGGAPTQEGILVRVPAGHVVQVGKFYRPVGHPTGFTYTLDDTPQPPASSIELTVDNFNTCAGACAA